MKPASPYFTADEARAYLRIPTMNAFYIYRSRLKLKGYRRGGKLLFKQSDLDASLYEERPERLRKVAG